LDTFELTDTGLCGPDSMPISAILDFAPNITTLILSDISELEDKDTTYRFPVSVDISSLRNVATPGQFRLKTLSLIHDKPTNSNPELEVDPFTFRTFLHGAQQFIHELQTAGFQIEILRVNATPTTNAKDFNWLGQDIPRFEVVKHEYDFSLFDCTGNYGQYLYD
jgi:hypothetical protein